MKKILAGLTLGVMVMGGAALAMKSAEAYGGMHGNSDHRGGQGGYHTRYADMTDAQKADYKARHEQMLEWRKKDLQADVTAGKITQKEADARIAIMQERFQAMQDGKYNTTPRARYADMTDAQKADFKARHEQRLEWHKKDLQAAVEAGKLTQSEADARIERMQARFKDMQDGNWGMHNRHNYKGDRHNNDGYKHKGDRQGYNHRHNSDCPVDCAR